MTTIAYKDGVLAGDSLSTVNGRRSGPMEKTFAYRLLGGGACLIGLCGEPQHFQKVLRDIIKREEDPLREEIWPIGEYMALIALKHEDRPERQADVYLFEGAGEPFPVSGPFHAIGSGSEIAIGAMAVGASALQAVHAAIALDIYSGPPVITLTFPVPESSETPPGQQKDPETPF